MMNIFFVYVLIVQGPDFCWHIDGYDKLKPYGFAIHGCIDGLIIIHFNNNYYGILLNSFLAFLGRYYGYVWELPTMIPLLWVITTWKL